MLLVLLLGIADFGRVFASGITVEAIARNASEAAAQEYLQARRAAAPSQPPASAYEAAHDRAQEVACEEAITLPNRAESGGTCSMPIIGVCIRDEWGAHCSALSGAAPPQCNVTTAFPSSLPHSAGDLPYADVTACYRFTTLFNLADVDLPFGWSLALGDIWLERERAFTVADY